ncbi:MAG: hypothetical protein ABW252_19785 [Polyangiales bacterium]
MTRRPPLHAMLLGLLLSSALAGCELIADFDSEEVEGRTVPVTPLPTLDGSVALMPDASVRDAALVTDPPLPDAGASDASVVVVGPMDAGD